MFYELTASLFPPVLAGVMLARRRRRPLFAMLGQLARGETEIPWRTALLVPRWGEKGEPPLVDVPQPLLTFTEPIALANRDAAQIPAAFLLTVEAGKEADDFDFFADRARAHGWEVFEMEGSHNPHWFQPEDFVDVLLQVIRE